MTDTPDLDPTLARLMNMGVPWHLAREAIASTALDHATEASTHEVRPGLPGWLTETPDGVDITDRD